MSSLVIHGHRRKKVDVLLSTQQVCVTVSQLMDAVIVIGPLTSRPSKFELQDLKLLVKSGEESVVPVTSPRAYL